MAALALYLTPADARGQWSSLETGASPEALDYGRWREQRAQANETTDSDKLLDFLAILDLRMIVVAYGRVFPLPTDDLLAAT